MFWCLWSFLAVTSFPSLCIPAGKSEKQSKMGFILAAARSLIECGKCLACGLYHESQIQVSDRADYVYVLCHHLGLLRLPALTFQEGNTSWGGVPDENYYWELRNSDFRLNLECTVSQGPTRQQQIFWRRPLVTGQGYSTIVQPHRCLQWPCFLGVTTFLYLCWHLIAKKNVVWSQNTKKLWAVIGKNSLIIMGRRL